MEGLVSQTMFLQMFSWKIASWFQSLAVGSLWTFWFSELGLSSSFRTVGKIPPNVHLHKYIYPPPDLLS